MTLLAINNARTYDWKTWTMGIMRSFLSGGAMAFATLGGGAAAGVHGSQLWTMTGINFLAMGLYRLGEFLQLHGAPDTVVTEEKTVSVQPEGDGVKATTVIKTTTSTEPPASPKEN